jgi:hypothetical protein
MALLTGPLRTDKGSFVDSKGRTVQLKGINLDGGSKYPRTPCMTSHVPITGTDSIFFDGDIVSFVGRPFPLDEAVTHLRRIKTLGYNVVRYVFTWEALEHKGPGQYDDEFIDYTIKMLKLIQKEGGLYVYLDPHQDVWNRFCGGDGAPMWTLYAAGLDPKKFKATEAAIVHNFFPNDPDAYPKMLWTTNYHRLATATMFTLFFAGKTFAPKCIINTMNIQDYLQSHYLNAIKHFLSSITKQAPELLDETLLGIESLNEPSGGFMGIPDITSLPPNQNLKLGTTPTTFQSLSLGMGIATEVDEYEISVFGPRKTGTKWVDPEGITAWLTDDSYDHHYGFRRDPSWPLGRCIWDLHGVWDSDTVTPLIKNYFNAHPQTGETIDTEYFINNYFVQHYAEFRNTVRDVFPGFFLFLEPPVLQIPPKLIGTDLIDERTVYCAHYYDGMSLMFKTWNRRYNVDTFGIMRNRYANPVFGMVFGEANIRKSFRRQLNEMKLEGEQYLGKIPILFSEIGMPFDMDNKKAFDEDDFGSQTGALDALGFALEGSNLSHTWWCYTAENCHKWGDRFNCEDFSFWSIDDDLDDSTLPGSSGSIATSSSQKKKEYSEVEILLDSDSATLNGSSSDLRSYRVPTNDQIRAQLSEKAHLGLRAVDAIIRPYPVALNGDFIDAAFDLRSLTYTLKLHGDDDISKPTIIHVPGWHFSKEDVITVSSGSYELFDDSDIVEWLHEPGEQTLEIKTSAVPESSSFFSSFLSSCCY